MRKVLLALLLLCPGLAYATTATFQEGISSYAGTKDANIVSFSTNEHVTNTARIAAFTDGYAYILYFNISTIPTNATVTSATIGLQLNEQNCTGETAGVRSIQNPDASSAFAANTVAADVFNQFGTWRFKNETGSVKWSTAGGSANFTDVYNNADENTQAVSACAGFALKTFTVTNMVQGWVTTPASNSGMVFSLSNTGNVTVKSRFDATASNHPLLTVNYTIAGSQSATNGFFF